MNLSDLESYREKTPYEKVFILGAGAGGTAIANTAARAGREVTLWCRNDEVIDTMTRGQENKKYLPGVLIEEEIKVTKDLNLAKDADAIFIVCPAQHFREMIEKLPKDIDEKVPFVICSKGIEIDTGKILSTVLQEVHPGRVFAVLSGPTFASETAKGWPTAVTVACTDRDIVRNVANAVSHKTFRPYITDDPIGAQICGAVKNVIAIACGIIHGNGMGDNARAALVTRGLQEIWRLGNAMGAKRKTFMGMSGIGDLMLTCSSMQSRNFSLGVMLGQGRSLEDILKGRTSVTEGVYTADSVIKLASKHAVDMPICRAVQSILKGEETVKNAIESVLTRPLNDEG